MAKKLSRIVDVFQTVGGIGHTEQNQTPRKVVNSAASMLSTSEREKIIRRIANTSQPSDLADDEPFRYAQDLAKRVSVTKKDNIEIRKLAPEVNQAAAIMIPSILSPTTLQEVRIQFTSASPDSSPEENDRVGQIITNFFNDHLKINVKMAEWIKEALYGAGSRPLLTIPITELDDLINNKAYQRTETSSDAEPSRVALESFDTLYKKTAEQVNVYGFGDTKQNHEIPASMESALESAYDSLTQAVSKHVPSYNDKKADQKDQRITKATEFFAELTKDVLAEENFQITDNIGILKSKYFNDVALERLDNKVKVKYKESAYISLSDQHDRPMVGHPLYLELPPESVLPVYTPGTPTEHLGYFILIDESGNPTSLMETSEQATKPINIQKRSTFDNLFKAFGFEDMRTYGQVESSVMNEIYQQIVDAHLKRRLKNNGFINVDLGGDNSVYRAMFARYLTKRKTKLLFVPKSFMTYFCFNYNENGTGRSKLEDMKFVLSLRITTLVCRMMSMMNSSVDRRNLTITLPPNGRVPNPLQFMEDIKREYLMKSLVTFSYDPNEVNRSMAQRGLSIKVKNMPGIPDYDITNELNERTAASFDTQLLEEIKNMMILDLQVPPSAFNATSENEYSRSVATTNLFFSRTIGHYQMITCANGGHFAKQYIGMSKPLQDQILEAIREVRKGDKKTGATEAKDQSEAPAETTGLTDSDIKDIGKKKDVKGKVKKSDKDSEKEELAAKDGTADHDAGLSDQKLLESIIAHIEMILPKSEVSPAKAQFEELDSFVQTLTTMIDSIYSDDLFSTDADLKEAIGSIRAMVKSQIIQEHLRRVGLGANIKLPDLKNFMSTDLLEIHQAATNLKTALAQQKALTSPTPTDGLGAETPPDTSSGDGAGGDIPKF